MDPETLKTMLEEVDILLKQYGLREMDEVEKILNTFNLLEPLSTEKTHELLNPKTQISNAG
jgi:hypothetical protein